ncbi:rod shape-determining protein [Candidatus Fukatsuia anoeciicola]|uniref:rod shape-determining protein n=1 Tax=Candidatus Fukatsuia anoeciicola TaxID=2994492 RepID=UPI003463EF0E
MSSSTTKVIIILFNNVIYFSLVRINGNRFNKVIINYARSNYSFLINKEKIKCIKYDMNLYYSN